MAYKDPNNNWNRSKDGAVLGGVCSGISEKVRIDVTILRLLFVGAFIFYGTGLGLYLILWIVLPEKGNK